MEKRGSLRERLEKRKDGNPDDVKKIDHGDEHVSSGYNNYHQLSKKQAEAETIRTQVQSKLNGSQLNDAQKRNLAQTSNRLNTALKNGDINAIDTAIDEVKAALNQKNTGGGAKKVVFIIIGIMVVLFLVNIATFRGCQFQPQNPQNATTTSTTNNKQNDIVGVWKGTYTENNTNGIGNLTLTVNDDMSGTIVFAIKRNTGQLHGSYTVSVTKNYGTYNVIGKEFINKPNTSNYGFDNFIGSVSNGVFSGSNFRFVKTTETDAKTSGETSTKKPQLEQRVDYAANVNLALNNARKAFNESRYLDAFNAYNEAANYPTERSNQIKQTAANDFKNEAERRGGNLATQLLQYAYRLNPSDEIQQLINKNGSTPSATSSVPGRFPQGSERILSASDLSGLSKYDLKIMRNEIFARHGYIFTTTDMRNYFQNQSWYRGRYGNVTDMLSSTEQSNVATIKRYE